MKSTEVYRVIRQMLGPWCKQRGLRRTPGGMLGWYLPADDKNLYFVVFWFQCSMDGWDRYIGSKFTLEFRLSPQPIIGLGSVRHRLPYFLTDDELDQMRRIQNDVIVRLPPPAADHFIFDCPPQTVAWYMSKFKPVEERYTQRTDVWMRYHEPADVERWVEFVRPVLPRAIEEVASGFRGGRPRA